MSSSATVFELKEWKYSILDGILRKVEWTLNKEGLLIPTDQNVSFDTFFHAVIKYNMGVILPIKAYYCVVKIHMYLITQTFN